MLPVILALVLVSFHFLIPLTYYAYLRHYFNQPWRTKIDRQHQPNVTIIVPAYNESEVIERRLENLVGQDYPQNKMAIIVVESGSTDGTATIVRDWLAKRGDINAKLIREPSRRGKLTALKRALNAVDSASEAVVFTDADAYWEGSALSEVMSFLVDPQVGSVTGSIYYVNDIGLMSGNAYRTYYNSVRVAESKIHSTPLQNGPLLAIRTDLLRKIGLPDFPGADDSAFGSIIAFAGYRAIQADNVVVKEYPRGDRLLRNVRRAQTLLLNFINTKRYAKERNVYVRSKFNKIWLVEWWLTVCNPWLLLSGVILLVCAWILDRSVAAVGLLAVGTLLLSSTSYRAWLLQQFYLILGTLRNLWTKPVVWNR